MKTDTTEKLASDEPLEEIEDEPKDTSDANN